MFAGSIAHFTVSASETFCPGTATSVAGSVGLTRPVVWPVAIVNPPTWHVPATWSIRPVLVAAFGVGMPGSAMSGTTTGVFIDCATSA